MSKPLKQIQKDYQKLKRRLPRIIGQYAVNFSKDSFRRQGFKNGGRINKWKQRDRSNEKGKKKGATLVRSGALKRSVRIIRASASEVVIGSDVPYAKIHNEGGMINQQVTAKQRAFFWAKYKATKNEMYKRMALAASLEIKMPQRQFMGDSTDLRKEVNQHIFKELKKIFN